MVRTFQEDELSLGLDICIAGGMLDEDDNSKDTSTALVSALQNSKAVFHLQVASLHSLNNLKVDGINSPIIRGIAIDLESGKVFPAEWKDKGAVVTLRQGRYSSVGELENIYDWEKDCVVIHPFPYRPLKIENIKVFLQLPDKQFLQYLSTSPEVEGPDFVKEAKAGLMFWLQNPSWEMFFQGKSLVFTWSSKDAQWTQL